MYRCIMLPEVGLYLSPDSSEEAKQQAAEAICASLVAGRIAVLDVVGAGGVPRILAPFLLSALFLQPTTAPRGNLGVPAAPATAIDGDRRGGQRYPPTEGCHSLSKLTGRGRRFYATSISLSSLDTAPLHPCRPPR